MRNTPVLQLKVLLSCYVFWTYWIIAIKKSFIVEGSISKKKHKISPNRWHKYTIASQFFNRNRKPFPVFMLSYRNALESSVERSSCLRFVYILQNFSLFQTSTHVSIPRWDFLHNPAVLLCNNWNGKSGTMRICFF